MGPVNVANDVCKIMGLTSNYIYQTLLTTEGTIVKVGNTASKQAGIVNVTLHRNANNNKLQDKLLAVKLAFKLHKYLRTTN